MSDRLYYQDAALREFTARILERNQNERGWSLRLDQSAFYATSGGQPHDTGWLNSIPVLDVWENEEGQVWHLVERLPDEDEVEGQIDWGRRFDHMQQHTGQHLLSAAFIDELEAHTIGFHLGKESNTIDLDIPDLEWEAALQVENDVNRVIWENRAVEVHFATQDEIKDIPLRKPPQVSGTVRVIWVRGYDASACGGTHVSYTAEVGLVKVTGLQRYKSGSRVTFLCGERALKDYQRALKALQDVSTHLSIHQNELMEAIQRLEEENKDSRQALKKARQENLGYESERLWNESPVVDGMRWIIAHWSNRSFDEARWMASHLRQREGTLILLAVTEAESLKLVCSRSDDLTTRDAAATLRKVTGLLGGRGGGSPEMAQGGAPTHTPEEILAAIITAMT